MINFKKFTLALLLAVAAVFTADAKFERVKEIKLPKGAKELKQDSDVIFSWQQYKGTRYLVYRGKLQEEGKKAKYVPMTVYTVTIPYDGVCAPGRQMMMYHPEGFSKGLLYSNATLQCINMAEELVDAAVIVPGTVLASFKEIGASQSAVAGSGTIIQAAQKSKEHLTL